MAYTNADYMRDNDLSKRDVYRANFATTPWDEVFTADGGTSPFQTWLRSRRGGGQATDQATSPAPSPATSPATNQFRPDMAQLRQQVDKMVNPYWQQAREYLDTSLTDQGIYDSTAAQGKRADIENKFAAQKASLASDLQNQLYGQWATGQQLGQTQQQLDLARQQAGAKQQNWMAEFARRIYENLASQSLAQKQLDLPATQPDQPNIFNYFRDYSYAPPQMGDGPAGDGPRETWGGAPLKGTALPVQKFEASQENAAANRALQQGYLALAREKFQHKRDNPDLYFGTGTGSQDENIDWLAVMGTASDRSIYPSERYNQITAYTGLDILGMAREGDERAQGIIRTLYPEDGDRIIAGDHTPLALGGQGATNERVAQDRAQRIADYTQSMRSGAGGYITPTQPPTRPEWLEPSDAPFSIERARSALSSAPAPEALAVAPRSR